MATVSDEDAAEFKDAIEDEEVEGDGNFPVTDEELAIIRAELASDFPDDYKYLSDAYILSVASKPYSKDPSIRRPLEVSFLQKKSSIADDVTVKFLVSRVISTVPLYQKTIVLDGKIEQCHGMAS